MGRFDGVTVVEGWVCNEDDDVQFPLWVEINGYTQQWKGQMSQAPTMIIDHVLIRWGALLIRVDFNEPYCAVNGQTVTVAGPLSWLDAIDQHPTNHPGDPQ